LFAFFVLARAPFAILSDWKGQLVTWAEGLVVPRLERGM
jgi:hypothetical protein